MERAQYQMKILLLFIIIIGNKNEQTHLEYLEYFSI